MTKHEFVQSNECEPMTGPRIWSRVTATHATLERWLCRLDCGHTVGRSRHVQRTRPAWLACDVCERERDEAVRPEWVREAISKGVGL